MKTTILKAKGLHIWVSGSRVDPYSNMYVDTKDSYKSIKVFPSLTIRKVYESYTNPDFSNVPYKYEWKFRISNSTPKWIKRILEAKSYLKDWEMNHFDDGCRFDEEKEEYYQVDPEPIPKKPSVLWFIYLSYLRDRKQKNCSHENATHTSDTSPDSGSEEFNCPDCGLYQHIQYY